MYNNSVVPATDIFRYKFQKSKKELIVQQLKKAALNNKLTIGINKVWEQAQKHRGWLILDEKLCNNILTLHDGNNYCRAIEEIIEKVLEEKGTVEIVEEGMLKDYGHIVMITY